MLPAIEVAIGLAFLFFVVALAASSIVEIIGTAFRLRASGLERTVREMLGEGDAEVATKFIESRVVTTLRETDAAWDIFGRPKQSRTIKVEARRKLPSRLPARAFADGVVDVLTDVKGSAGSAEDLFARLPTELRDRIQPMLDETGADLVAFKARLEQWFDDAMQGLEAMYRKWSRKLAFIVGLVLVVTLNASAVHVAQRLWTSSAERDAVVAAVDQLVPETPPADGSTSPTDTATSFSEVAEQIGDLEATRIPLGWGDVDVSFSWVVLTLIGWLITALLVRLGAPFWYDLIGRLVALRKGLGAPNAAADPASATTQVVAENGQGTRTTYAQGATERSATATPESSPAARLFAALPARR
ncbi:MAG: hypothetical protein H0U21_17310 [Acidimicrobiia bacterium]|nr:hypothetical protein [Acidimicrobiia bacterium]